MRPTDTQPDIEKLTEAVSSGLNGDFVVGIDMVALERVKTAYEKHGDDWFSRLLTPNEQAYCKDQTHPENFTRRVAARIALKEALAKALGVGINGLGWSTGIDWRDVETVSDHHVQPEIKLSGKAAAFSAAKGLKNWKISLSHDGDYAIAVVIALA